MTLKDHCHEQKENDLMILLEEHRISENKIENLEKSSKTCNLLNQVLNSTIDDMQQEFSEVQGQLLECSNRISNANREMLSENRDGSKCECCKNLETCEKSLQVMISSNKSLSNPVSFQRKVQSTDLHDYESLKSEYDLFKQTCFNMTLDAMVNLQNQQLRTSELLLKFNEFHSQPNWPLNSHPHIKQVNFLQKQLSAIDSETPGSGMEPFETFYLGFDEESSLENKIQNLRAEIKNILAEKNAQIEFLQSENYQLKLKVELLEPFELLALCTEFVIVFYKPILRLMRCSLF